MIGLFGLLRDGCGGVNLSKVIEPEMDFSHLLNLCPCDSQITLPSFRAVCFGSE